MLDTIKNTMSVEDFLEKYDKATTEQEQHNIIREIIIDEYVPYLVKKAALVPVINKSAVKNDGTLPYFDETLFEVNYFICLLVLYTNLNIEDYLEEHSAFDTYDEFCKRKIKGAVFGLINANEINEIDSLAEKLKKNWVDINRGTDNVFIKMYLELTNAIVNGIDTFIDASKENDTSNTFFKKIMKG